MAANTDREVSALKAKEAIKAETPEQFLAGVKRDLSNPYQPENEREAEIFRRAIFELFGESRSGQKTEKAKTRKREIFHQKSDSELAEGLNPEVAAIREKEAEFDKLSNEGRRHKLEEIQQQVQEELKQRMLELDQELDEKYQRLIKKGVSSAQEKTGVSRKVHNAFLLTEIQAQEEKILERKRKMGFVEKDVLNEHRIEVFALAASQMKASLGIELYDIQLKGALVLHDPAVVGQTKEKGIMLEMKTAEGKTFVAVPVLILNSLLEKGCYLFTANDYLVKRDLDWVGGVYEALGIETACLVDPKSHQNVDAYKYSSTEEHENSNSDFQSLKKTDRLSAHKHAKIVYSTSHQAGFDFLREDMDFESRDAVIRPFALVDEADDELLDKSRTPLVISGKNPNEELQHHQQGLREQAIKIIEAANLKNAPVTEEQIEESQRDYRTRQAKNILEFLKPKRNPDPKDGDFVISTKTKTIRLTGRGMDKIEQTMKELLGVSFSLEINDEIREAIRQSQGKDVFSLADLREFLLTDYKPELKSPDFRESPEKMMAGLNRQAGIVSQINSLVDKNSFVVHLLNQIETQLQANYCLKRDVDYAVINREAVIIDLSTGRLLPGQRWQNGLHEAIEVKENIEPRQEQIFSNSISLIAFFRHFRRLSGMSGTIDQVKEEFKIGYNCGIFILPTNIEEETQKGKYKKISYGEKTIYISPSGEIKYAPIDEGVVLFLNRVEKIKQIVFDIEQAFIEGRASMYGASSVEDSELIAAALKKKWFAGVIDVDLLNARRNEQEAQIYEKKAGKPGHVTLTTSMAGRGVDIIAEGEKAGGLETNPAYFADLRVARQIKGRNNRRGQPAIRRQYISADEEAVIAFAGNQIRDFLIKHDLKSTKGYKPPAWLEKFSERTNLPLTPTQMVKQVQIKFQAFHLGVIDSISKEANLIEGQRAEFAEKLKERARNISDPEKRRNALGNLNLLWSYYLQDVEDVIRPLSYNTSSIVNVINKQPGYSPMAIFESETRRVFEEEILRDGESIIENFSMDRALETPPEPLPEK